ncbi:MAG: Rha family transcriptional regulator [Desulfobulbaceae bacterium]
MKELAAATNPTTRISSLEIADRTDKRHDIVMRDIRNLIDQGAIDLHRCEEIFYLDQYSRSQPAYSLDLEAMMTLVTGYDAPRRNAVIKRWLALERGEAVPLAEMAGRAPADLHETLLDVPVINNLISCMSETMTTMNRVIGRLEKLEAAPSLKAPAAKPKLASYGALQVAGFVSACCRATPLGACRKDVLYSHYLNFCREAGLDAFSYNGFFALLYRATGLRQVHRHRGSRRHNLIGGIVPLGAPRQHTIPGLEVH